MTNFVVLRSYRRSDEPFCKILLRNGIMENINRTLIELILKDVTLNVAITVVLTLFLLLGFSILSCIIAMIIKGIVLYVITYISFWAIAKKIQKEVSEIPRIYKSDNSSYFWVAEIYEDYLLNRHQQDQKYIFMTEKKFNESNINVFRYVKKIVGTIALCKSTRLQNSGWIKRLSVHKDYRRKGIGTNLVNLALQFGSQQGYRRINVIISEPRKAARELFSKKGFEIYLYRRRFFYRTSVLLLFVELTYRMRYNDNDAELLATDPFYTQAH
ncbi:putative N-acetyltransferase camello isoform X1 [Vespula squamosa]|uniref:N-acetyltransferase camello isoform X1 n=1 Tax=Vespula squamosa TaxID=30214 RepID=A0ABD2C920_VESSQ